MTELSELTLYAWALRWLDAGRLLVPLQPGSKWIVGGYGPVVRVVTDLAEAHYWWGLRRCNIGLVTGYGVTVLDFDDCQPWREFCAQFPGVADTFTVRTRRGAHVYMAGQVTVAVPGAEVKYNSGLVVTCPSVVAGHSYQPVNSGAQILQVPADLSLLSESQFAAETTLPAAIVKPDVARPGGDTVSRIKQALPILDFAQKLTKLSTKDGRFYHGQCPIPGHTKHRVNFYVDIQRSVFKCYGCGNNGDVINLYSLVKDVKLPEAISQLAHEVLCV